MISPGPKSPAIWPGWWPKPLEQVSGVFPSLFLLRMYTCRFFVCDHRIPLGECLLAQVQGDDGGLGRQERKEK